MKIKNSSIKLPDEFLDTLLLNDGDFLVLVEENGKYYIRKTFESSHEEPESTDSEQKPPPPSMDEMMKKVQEQFSEMPNLGGGANEFMKTIENTLNNPEMMKKIQEMAKDMFKGFVDQNTADSNDEKKNDEDEEDDEDEDDDGTAYKIDID